jgi:hypothetical protein
MVKANQFYPPLASPFLRWRILCVPLPLVLKFGLLPRFLCMGLVLSPKEEHFIHTLLNYVRSEAITAVKVNEILSDYWWCQLVRSDRRLRGHLCPNDQDLK